MWRLDHRSGKEGRQKRLKLRLLLAGTGCKKHRNGRRSGLCHLGGSHAVHLCLCYFKLLLVRNKVCSCLLHSLQSNSKLKIRSIDCNTSFLHDRRCILHLFLVSTDGAREQNNFIGGSLQQRLLVSEPRDIGNMMSPPLFCQRTCLVHSCKIRFLEEHLAMQVCSLCRLDTFGLGHCFGTFCASAATLTAFPAPPWTKLTQLPPSPPDLLPRTQTEKLLEQEQLQEARISDLEQHLSEEPRSQSLWATPEREHSPPQFCQSPC